MNNKMESIPFIDSPEKHAKLEAIIAEHKTMRGALVQVLKLAQEVYGYLPLEVQEQVAEGLDLPLEEVYGVVSFYSLFSTVPKGRYKISVCLGTACYVKGARAIIDKLAELLNIPIGGCTPDGKFSLEACRCLGACGLAPVMTINSEVYGRLTPDMLPCILAKYAD